LDNEDPEFNATTPSLECFEPAPPSDAEVLILGTCDGLIEGQTSSICEWASLTVMKPDLNNPDNGLVIETAPIVTCVDYGVTWWGRGNQYFPARGIWFQYCCNPRVLSPPPGYGGYGGGGGGGGYGGPPPPGF
jgi:hypothetical protein